MFTTVLTPNWIFRVLHETPAERVERMALEMGSECSKDAAMEGRKSIDYGKNTNNGFIDSDDEEGSVYFFSR